MQRRQPFHHVLQLADVARPSLAQKRLVKLRRARQTLAVAPGEAFQEEARQVGNILDPVAQSRQLDRDHAQPVIEFLAKGSRLDLCRQVLVGRAQDATIHPYRRQAAQPPQNPLLHKAEQPRLQFHTQVADFIKKQRAAVG